MSLSSYVPTTTDQKILLQNLQKIYIAKKNSNIINQADSIALSLTNKYKELIKYNLERCQNDSNQTLQYEALLSDSLYFTNYQDSIREIEFYRLNNLLANENMNLNYDLYFITNITLQKPTGQDIGGFHNPGSIGGIQTQYTSTDPYETREILTAHEMGHWLGLSHTFKILSLSNEVQSLHGKCFYVTGYEKQTDSNFMDYFIDRKTWFKFQMEEVK